MKKTRFTKPYNKNGSTKFPDRKRAGVYLIKSDSSSEIVYVGSSESDLYKAMYHHFNTWNDKQMERATYDRNRVTVRVVYCTPAQAITLERALIRKHQPRDNSQKYENLFNQNQEAKLLDSYESAPFAAIEAPF